MKRFIILLIFIVLLACSCEDTREKAPKGSRTIEGTYVCDVEDLYIGYIFGSDGYGMQIIGDEQYNINYYILGDSIVIENFSVSGGDKTTLDFYESDGKIYIAEMPFTKMK